MAVGRHMKRWNQTVENRCHEYDGATLSAKTIVGVLEATDMSTKEIADRAGWTNDVVTNRLRIHRNHLPQSVQSTIDILNAIGFDVVLKHRGGKNIANGCSLWNK